MTDPYLRALQQIPDPGVRAALSRMRLSQAMQHVGEMARMADRFLSGEDDPPAPTVELRDGTIGYGMRRMDDCLQTAIATLLQVPVEEVPDPCVDRRLHNGDDPATIVRESWAALDNWLADRRLAFARHIEDLPCERERWIGVVEHSWIDSTPAFDGHTLVMARGEVLHDVAYSVPAPPGVRVAKWTAADVRWAITIGGKVEPA